MLYEFILRNGTGLPALSWHEKDAALGRTQAEALPEALGSETPIRMAGQPAQADLNSSKLLAILDAGTARCATLVTQYFLKSVRY